LKENVGIFLKNNGIIDKITWNVVISTFHNVILIKCFSENLKFSKFKMIYFYFYIFLNSSEMAEMCLIQILINKIFIE